VYVFVCVAQYPNPIFEFPHAFIIGLGLTLGVALIHSEKIVLFVPSKDCPSFVSLFLLNFYSIGI